MILLHKCFVLETFLPVVLHNGMHSEEAELFDSGAPHCGCTTQPFAAHGKGDSSICGHAFLVNQKVWLDFFKYFLLWVEQCIRWA